MLVLAKGIGAFSGLGFRVKTNKTKKKACADRLRLQMMKVKLRYPAAGRPKISLGIPVTLALLHPRVAATSTLASVEGSIPKPRMNQTRRCCPLNLSFEGEFFSS